MVTKELEMLLLYRRDWKRVNLLRLTLPLLSGDWKLRDRLRAAWDAGGAYLPH